MIGDIVANGTGLGRVSGALPWHVSHLLSARCARALRARRARAPTRALVMCVAGCPAVRVQPRAVAGRTAVLHALASRRIAGEGASAFEFQFERGWASRFSFQLATAGHVHASPRASCCASAG